MIKRLIVAVAVIAALAGGALLGLYVLGQGPFVPTSTEQGPVADAGGTTPQPQPEVGAKSSEQPANPQADATAKPTPPSEPTSVPTFDVVVIEPSGEGVIAGRAAPGWKVSVQSGGVKVAEAKADTQGEWSVVLDKPLAAGSHALSLKITSPDGTRALSSQESVRVAVGDDEKTGSPPAAAEAPDAPAPAPQVAAPQPTEQEPEAQAAVPPKAAPAPAQPAPAPTPAPQAVAPPPAPQAFAPPPAPQAFAPPPAPQAVAPPPAPQAFAPPPSPQAVAPPPAPSQPAPPGEAPQVAAAEPVPTIEALPRSASSGQSAPAPRPTLVFKTVDYSDTGAATGTVTLSGVADPGAKITIYSDNEHLAEARVGNDGTWRVVVQKKLGMGQHSFRAEQASAAGAPGSSAVVSIERVEPKPEPPKAPQVATGPASVIEAVKKEGVGTYIIKRGDTLWAIAKRYLGSGLRYTLIFEDNRKVIRNPNLIHPKQELTVPAQER
jgi:nucleoid-associated protein YgaU